MKKKIANIVEIVIEIIILILFFTMKGTATMRINGVDTMLDTTFINALHHTSIYAVIFYVLWAVNLLACIASIVSKNKSKDNTIHCILPIILLLVSDWIVLSYFSETNNFWIANLMMFIMVVVSFIKRSQSIVDEVKKVVVVNETQSNADELKKYKDLLDNGTITQEEFDQKKSQLLGL